MADKKPKKITKSTAFDAKELTDAQRTKVLAHLFVKYEAAKIAVQSKLGVTDEQLEKMFNSESVKDDLKATTKTYCKAIDTEVKGDKVRTIDNEIETLLKSVVNTSDDLKID